jgi:hypothetical protein
VVRCPSKLIAERIGRIIANFYDHLARRLYSELQRWQALHVTVTRLQEYLDSERKAHYVEDVVGIVPNSTITRRESQLYADIQADEDGALSWNEPQSYKSGLPRSKPAALRVAEALSAYGIFTRKGLDAVAEVWGRLEFKDNETRADAERLTEELVKQLISEGVASAAATPNDLNALRRLWQMPMYHLYFRKVDVPLEDLTAQRDAKFAAEMGYYQL